MWGEQQRPDNEILGLLYEVVKNIKSIVYERYGYTESETERDRDRNRESQPWFLLSLSEKNEVGHYIQSFCIKNITNIQLLLYQHGYFLL